MLKTDLCLMLHPPSGEGQQGLQERQIPDVPLPLAQKISRDFFRQSEDPSVGRYNLYRIEEAQSERLLPLDFGEVAGILYRRGRA
jgi:hypothetical protein